MTTLLDLPITRTDAEFARIVDELTRRGFLAGGLGSAALLALAACGSSGATSERSSTAAGWSFTDDLGQTITLPRKPTRIASLWDSITATAWSAGLHNLVASQLAPGNQTMLTQTQVTTTALTRLSVGNTAQVNIEALAAAKPDLILDMASAGKLTTTSQQAAIAKIAPVAGLNTTGPDVPGIIGHAERLVTALGITLADAAAHADYQAAARRLTAALNAKPGLRVAFVWDTGQGSLDVYGTTGGNAWITTLKNLGMTLVPETPYPGVSWERVPQIAADLLLQTGGEWPITNPAWKAMPAVKAGQAYNTDDWGAGWYAYDYPNYTILLDRLTALVQTAKPGTGPR